VDSDRRETQKVKKYNSYVYGEKEGGGTQYIVLASVPYEKLGLPKLPPYSSSGKSEKLQHTLYSYLISPAVLFGGLMVAAYSSTKKENKE
jgi:hypothetical protein